VILILTVYTKSSVLIVNISTGFLQSLVTGSMPRVVVERQSK